MKCLFHIGLQSCDESSAESGKSFEKKTASAEERVGISDITPVLHLDFSFSK